MQSKTLINNIFSNKTENGSISGNIISTISDHFAQFLLQKDKKKTRTNQIYSFKNYKFKKLKWGLIWFQTKTDRLEHNSWNR